MPGPAPKPASQRARRNATVAMTKLDAKGRTGRAPAWPLGSDTQLETEIELTKLQIKDIGEDVEWASTSRERSAARRRRDRVTKRQRELEALRKAASKIEREIWAGLWKTPQAIEWEKSGWFREVAQYARHKAKAESGSLDDAKEARQLADRLGLTPLALLRLRWEIVDDAEPTRRPARSRRSSSRYGDLRVIK